MNTAQLKAISWGSALLFGGALAAYVANYLMHRAEREQRVQAAEITTQLGKVVQPPKKVDNNVSYESVHASLFKFNWTGKPPPPPPVVEQAKPEPKPGDIQVSTLLRVMLVKVDAQDPAGSRAVIKYEPASKVVTKSPALVKHIGDRLDPPIDWVIVSGIQSDGVTFKFTDAKRAEELVQVGEYVGRLDMAELARGGSVIQVNQPVFERTATYNKVPERTVKLSETEYVVGTEDVLEWDQNYDVYLTEIQHERHRDPTTGKFDGIVLTDVPAGSTAAKYGAKSGDVIKSINGHPVNSSQEAIAYAKNNKDKFDVWEIEVESKGKTKFITYKVPKKK